MPATLLPRRDVDTSLTYWKSASKPVVLDFTAPGADVKYKELDANDESHKITVEDIRGREDDFSLERNGFVYVKNKVEGLEACSTEEEFEKLIIPATEKLVKELTGAHKTIVFTSRIRNVSQDANKLAANRAPALSVHSDFSPAGARHNVLELLQVPAQHPSDDEAAEERERQELQLLPLRGGGSRVLLVNVWRPLRTAITRDPLAVCDWATVDAAADLVPLRFRFAAGRWNELGKWRRGDGHRWYYLGGQRPDEPVVFVQYDSRSPDGMTLPHSAFEDGEYLSGPPRESIEIKMAAFVD